MWAVRHVARGTWFRGERQECGRDGGLGDERWQGERLAGLKGGRVGVVGVVVAGGVEGLMSQGPLTPSPTRSPNPYFPATILLTH